MRLGFLLIAAGLLSLLGLGCCWLRPALQERGGGGGGSANCTVLAVRQLGERFPCTFSCGASCRGTARYPCLQVLVRTSRSPAPALLHEDERQLRTNPKVRPETPRTLGGSWGGGPPPPPSVRVRAFPAVEGLGEAVEHPSRNVPVLLLSRKYTDSMCTKIRHVVCVYV